MLCRRQRKSPEHCEKEEWSKPGGIQRHFGVVRLQDDRSDVHDYTENIQFIPWFLQIECHCLNESVRLRFEQFRLWTRCNARLIRRVSLTWRNSSNANMKTQVLTSNCRRDQDGFFSLGNEQNTLSWEQVPFSGRKEMLSLISNSEGLMKRTR